MLVKTSSKWFDFTDTGEAGCNIAGSYSYGSAGEAGRTEEIRCTTVEGCSSGGIRKVHCTAVGCCSSSGVGDVLRATVGGYCSSGDSG